MTSALGKRQPMGDSLCMAADSAVPGVDFSGVGKYPSGTEREREAAALDALYVVVLGMDQFLNQLISLGGKDGGVTWHS